MSKEVARDSPKLAAWLEEVHEQVKLSAFDEWPAIVAEQKPMIEELMKRANTDNPLSAVIPVVQTIPVGDGSRLLLLAVAAEMIMRGQK